jgi:tetratricopeptide (TPR) repeat protein/transcriptional regulator with XRE-family HTH domain
MAAEGEVPFGALLKHYREAAGLTQEELAEAAGVSGDAISTLERGARRAPRADTVRLLVHALALGAAERTALEAAVDRRRGPPLRSATPQGQKIPPPGRQPHTGGPMPPLVGRHHEQRILAQCLAGEGPPLVLFAGEPGIGKSRLLHEAAARGAAQGWHVLQGGCQRRGGQEPYAPVLEALEDSVRRQAPAHLKTALAGCAWLVRLLPELVDTPIEPLPAWTLSPEQEWRLVVKAVRRYLGQVAGPAGTLLLLDDLQWAGADALELLAVLVRSAAEIPLHVVGAYRDTETTPDDALSTLLADLAHARLVRRVTLAPLAEPAAVELLAGLLQGVNGAPPAARVVQRTGGVPFFLVSYAQALREPAREDTRDGVPWDLAQGLRQRVAALPGAAREVLSTAALIGRVVPYALLTSVVDLPEREVIASLEAASRARLIAGEEGQHAAHFAHDVIREAIEADVPVVRRVALHRRIAAVLERQAEDNGMDPPVEALVYHCAHGGDQEKAILYLEQAGDLAATQYANTAADGHYHELVERLDRSGRTRDAAGSRLKLAAVLMRIARYDAALAVLEKAAEIYSAVDDREGLRRTLAVIGNAHTGRLGMNAQSGQLAVQGGLARLLPLAESLDPGGATEGWAAFQAALANLFLMSGRYSEELAAAARATEIARALGDQTLLATALERQGQALMLLTGRRAEARTVVEEARRVAEETANLEIVCEANADAAWIALERGEFEAGEWHNRQEQAAAKRLGAELRFTAALFSRGLLAFYKGDWQAARRDIMTVDHTGSMYFLLQKGRLHGAEGDRETARRYLEESSDLAVRSNHLLPLRAAQKLLAEYDLEEGHPAAAHARLAALLARSGVNEMDVHEVLPVLAWAHLELGRVAEAGAVIAQAICGMRADDNVLDLVDALRVQALVATRQGHWVAAEQALEEGLRHARRMPYPHAEARLLHTWGVLLLRKGEGEAAGHRLAAALEMFGRLGARAHAEEVEGALATLMPR